MFIDFFSASQRCLIRFLFENPAETGYTAESVFFTHAGYRDHTVVQHIFRGKNTGKKISNI